MHPNIHVGDARRFWGGKVQSVLDLEHHNGTTYSQPRLKAQRDTLTPTLSSVRIQNGRGHRQFRCPGLTAYAALKRHTNRPERGPVLLIGLGGVGMMGLAIARALFTTPPIVADIDAEKRNAALAAGAAQGSDATLHAISI